VKQIIYTCACCTKQVAVDPRTADSRSSKDEHLPMEWAEIFYRRVHTTTTQDGQQQTVQTICTAHACGKCAKEVLDYLEPPQPVQRQIA
jgi:hypothetical protein